MRKWSVKPDYIVKDLAEAARLIIMKSPSAKPVQKRASRNGKRRRLKTLI